MSGALSASLCLSVVEKIKFDVENLSQVQEGKEILSFLHSLSPDTYVNIMEQVRLHNNISLKNLTEIFTV